MLVTADCFAFVINVVVVPLLPADLRCSSTFDAEEDGNFPSESS